MGELGLNKIFGAACATALGILGLQTLSAGVFSDGGHHSSHKPESLAEWAEESFPGYHPDIKEVGGEPEPEPIFDLGLALANADLSRGQRSLGAKCKSCHTWDEGGANGTGPNLYGVVGRDIGSAAGFGYSKSFQDYPGNWTYEELNGFIKNPKQHISGTVMAYNGVSNDNERAAIIAYLASQDAGAPAFPAPLPAVVEEAVGEVVEND